MLYHEECEMFMDNVLDCMKNAIVNKATHLTFDRDIPRRMLSNTKRMIFSSNLMQLKKALDQKVVKDIPVIIVSAGPSLDKNIHELKRRREKHLLLRWMLLFVQFCRLGCVRTCFAVLIQILRNDFLQERIQMKYFGLAINCQIQYCWRNMRSIFFTMALLESGGII